MRCEGCGAQLQPDAAECHECGEEIGTPSTRSAPFLPPPPVETKPKSSPELKALQAPPPIERKPALPPDMPGAEADRRLVGAAHAAGYGIVVVLLLIAVVAGRWYVAHAEPTQMDVVIGARASTMTPASGGESLTRPLSEQGSVFSHFASAGMALLVGLGLALGCAIAAAVQAARGGSSFALGLLSAGCAVVALGAWFFISRRAAGVIDAELGASVYVTIGAIATATAMAFYSRRV